MGKLAVIFERLSFTTNYGGGKKRKEKKTKTTPTLAL